MAIHNGQRKLALVVDDSLVNRALLNYWLNQQSYEVIQAATLAEARERLAQTTPDIVIVDLQLPDGSGEQLAGEYDGPSTFTWVATSLPVAEAQWAHMQASGFDLFLSKPFDHHQLLHVLEVSQQQHSGTASPLPAEDAIPVLDFDTALHHLGGDIAFMQELVTSFLEDWSDLPERLGSAIQQADYSRLAREAHTAAGLAGQFGLQALMQRLHLLEMAAREDTHNPLVLSHLQAMATYAFSQGVPRLLAVLPGPQETSRGTPP